jgi:N-acetylglucosaminyl-diphospho-decaprenol L-rhamnosyltransferase
MDFVTQQDELDEELTIIVVSYNTKALTLRALETLYENAGDVRMRVIVWDNASADDSADAIAAAFPEVELVRSPDNLGFAVANNRASEMVLSEWMLLLNPDTETYPNAIAALLDFAKANPRAGIVGGRTVFPDGSLNPASCWNKITIWSLICNAFGLAAAFPASPFFNPEGIGGWKRDSVRQVDIVVGCFLLIPTALWRKLDGFQAKYFMYGEEADLCLRAAKAGYRPMITPDAQIMHLVGASTPQLARKLLQLMQARATLVRDHWSPATRWIGLSLLQLWSFNHVIKSRLMQVIGKGGPKNDAWFELWDSRTHWLKGYEQNIN